MMPKVLIWEHISDAVIPLQRPSLGDMAKPRHRHDTQSGIPIVLSNI